MCSYMNSCNGHGSCSKDTGKCTCKAGWFGADCLTEVTPATDNFRFMGVKGSRWQYFSVKENSAFTLNVTSSPEKFDLYFRKGGEIPDAVNFDAVIKGRHEAVINEFFLGDYEGFIFAVHTNPVQLNTPASLQPYDY